MVALSKVQLVLDRFGGIEVTMEIEHKRVVFDDDVASWLKQYTDALTRIKEWQEVADIARSHLENAMGDAEVAMHNGNEVVRWSFVESKRIDVKKAREILPDQVIQLLEVPTTSRRFTIVDNGAV
jgi:predicted phage-related endonuclease